jgi:two-component system NarL family response regulator
MLGVHSTVSSLRAEPGSPDVVLTFGRATDGSATEVIRAAKESWPGTTLLAAPETDRLDEVLGLLRAGADGYLPRSSSLDDLLALVERAGRGDTLLPATMIQEIARRVDSTRRESGDPSSVARLTRREMEVLRSLKEGLGTRAIAERDATSRATVRTHIQNILRKLRAHSILEAVTFSVRYGIVDAPSPETSGYDDEGSSLPTLP